MLDFEFDECHLLDKDLPRWGNAGSRKQRPLILNEKYKVHSTLTRFNLEMVGHRTEMALTYHTDDDNEISKLR